jgi:arylformamidase
VAPESLYTGPAPSALFFLAEGLLEYEQQFARWRFAHVQLVERIIGPMTQGTAARWAPGTWRARWRTGSSRSSGRCGRGCTGGARSGAAGHPAVTDRARFLDASVVLRPGTPEWPGDTPFGCGWTARVADGSSVNLSSLTMSPHVGTHADAPLTCATGGPRRTRSRSRRSWARRWSSTCRTPTASSRSTRCSRAPPRRASPRSARRGSSSAPGAPSPTGAFPRGVARGWPPTRSAPSRAAGLVLLGVDAPSVDGRESKTLDAHHALFGAGAYNLENLDLRAAAPGRYELLAAPLSLDGLDAAPARALLRPLS